MMRSLSVLGVMLVVTCSARSAVGGQSATAKPFVPYETIDLKGYLEGYERTDRRTKKELPRIPYRSSLAFAPESAPSEEDGVVRIGGVPFLVSRDAKGHWQAVDVGLSKWRTRESDERSLSFYPGWCRASAKDGDLVFHLPKGLYFRAHLLAASSGREGAEPIVTLRAGLFQNRGFLANTTVDVPAFDATASAGPLPVPGQVVNAQGKAQSARLFVVPVTIPVGDLLKIVSTDKYLGARISLDVQLMARLHVKVSAPDPANFSMMPLGLPSAVQVFGITFERAPVSLLVEGDSTWNIFPDAKTPAMNLILQNLTDQPHAIEMAARWRGLGRDAGGSPGVHSWKLTLAARESKTVKHELACERVGLHEYAATLKDASLGELAVHRTTFARLPKFPNAPLKPGLRSRFCTWWWNGTHSTLSGDAGLDAVDWLGLGYVHWFTRTKNSQALAAERGVRGYFDKAILCLHEFNISGPQMMQYPPIMTGEPRYKLNEKEEARFQATWKQSVDKCEKTRAESPDTEIIFGNSSFNGIEEFLHRKFPSKLFDSLGHESCALMRMPERQPELASVQEAYWFKRALEEYGYKQPLTGCAEGRYHATNPGNHSWQAQADLYVRDILHDLAYGFSRICPSCMDDVGNGYYWSNWGASGLVTRAPDVHPKLSYVTYAVAGHILSDADFVRAVPTGSHSAYCLEFDRRRGDKVFACWTLRGSRPMTLRGSLGSPSSPEAPLLTGSQGNTRRLVVSQGAVAFDITPSPVFVEAIKKCEAVALGPPVYGERPRVRTQVVSALRSLTGWRSISEPSNALDNDNFDYARQKGEFEVKVVDDEAKGQCLQFALKGLGGRKPWIPAYQTIALKKPIEIPDQPTAIGLYVKGNSGWGRINLELRDAKGERWLSIGMPNAWNANDEMSVSYIIFDGWRWMQIPLPGHYPSGFHWPRYANWRHDDGDGIVDYPLSLTGVVVEQRQKIVYVTEMVDASTQPVRIAELTAVYGDPERVDDWERHGESLGNALGRWK